MKRISYTLSKIILTLGLPILVGACEFLDVEPKEVVPSDNMYRDKNDANAIVKGIYGKFISLAEQHVILNELRADLMDVTPNAHYWLQEINLHSSPSMDNPYANPVPYYELINQCNDALHNFNLMLNDLRLLEDEYNQRYSDIATLRSWIYLQLVIQFGEVPYITEPLESVESIETISANAPILNIESMVDSLVSFMEGVPSYRRYSDPDMKTAIDGYQMDFLFIDKLFFMGDLYLWDENYYMAASMYKELMDLDLGRDSYDTYKIPQTYDPYNVDNYNSTYYRYYFHDINNALNHWPWMFSTNNQDDDYYCEWIWAMEFDEIYAPVNPFFHLCSRNEGDYMLKPSQYAIDLWDAQIQYNDFTGDFRGNTGSYIADEDGSNPEITKYTSEYDMLDPFNFSGKYMLQRAGQLHLRFSEAANREEYHQLAYHLVNDGMVAYNPIPDSLSTVAGAEVGMYNNTNAAFPFNFNGLKSESYHIPSTERGEYYRNGGLRGRVYLKNVEIPEGVDSLINIEDMIIQEAALELAFEGHRWNDLVRIAIHRNDPSFLADRVYEKLVRGGHSEADAVRSKLMSRENWFLPLPE